MNFIKLKPAYKDYIWGGERLKRDFGKNTPYPITAESWEASCLEDGMSYVEGGPCDGMSMKEYVAQNKGCLGTSCAHLEEFPLLIKLIDARTSLSVQVHPDDNYARQNEGQSFGKTEMWYVMDAEPGATLVYGLCRDTNREEFRTALEEDRLGELLNQVSVKAGDVIFVPAGLVHAIGKGILICEIQQSSNLTYRVYDWGRVGTDGKPRELHTKKALDVTDFRAQCSGDFAPRLVREENGTKDYLAANCPYFKVMKREQETSSVIATTEESFAVITFLEGQGRITEGDDSVAFKQGETFFLPSGNTSCRVDGNCSFLVTTAK